MNDELYSECAGCTKPLQESNAFVDHVRFMNDAVCTDCLVEALNDVREHRQQLQQAASA